METLLLAVSEDGVEKGFAALFGAVCVMFGLVILIAFIINK